LPGNSAEFNLRIETSQCFSRTYPEAFVGVLVLKNIKPQLDCENLKRIEQEIVQELQKSFPDLSALKADPVIKVYSRYYKKFKKSYHVLGQLQSIIFEKLPLPTGTLLVETMFAVELKNKLLTAIHDLDSINYPLQIEISTGEEKYTTLRGEEQQLKIKDMMMRDQAGVISSVIYGPDKRTCVSPATTNVIFAVYAPTGIEKEAVNNHFEDIKHIIGLFSPQFEIVQQEIYPEELKR
jgi:DNA/RNA-binding domain of Phe-tRNA-synthetase-like protein